MTGSATETLDTFEQATGLRKCATCGFYYDPDLTHETHTLLDEARCDLNDFAVGLPSVPVRPDHEDADEVGPRRFTRKSERAFEARLRETAERLTALGVPNARKRLEDHFYV